MKSIYEELYERIPDMDVNLIPISAMILLDYNHTDEELISKIENALIGDKFGKFPSFLNVWQYRSTRQQAHSQQLRIALTVIIEAYLTLREAVLSC